MSMLESTRRAGVYGKRGHDSLLTVHPEDRGGDAWMLSYMDIMTLLLAFFVLLLSLSNPAETVSDALASVSQPSAPVQSVVEVSEEAVAVAQRIGSVISPQARDAAMAVAASLAVPQPQLNEDALAVARQIGEQRLITSQAIDAANAIVRNTFISEAAQAAAMQIAGEWRVREVEKPLPVIEGVEISRVKGGINLRIQDHLLFDSGEADLTGAGESVTQRLVEIIQRYEGTVSVEGHSDSVPISTARFPSNWELSSGRATAILRYLNRAGVDTSRLRAVGYADTRPIESNDSQDGRAANRRVEVIIHEAGDL